MSEHLDLDALAYLDEGLLDGTPQEPGARTHLASCTACQEQLADLVAVRATLTSVPPERGIPFDVARRLDVALAAEAKARTEHAVVPLAVGADRVATVAARQTVVTRLPRRRLFPRLLAAAASVAAVGTIGYVATQTLDPSGGSGSGTEVAAGLVGRLGRRHVCRDPPAGPRWLVGDASAAQRRCRVRTRIARPVGTRRAGGVGSKRRPGRAADR